MAQIQYSDNGPVAPVRPVPTIGGIPITEYTVPTPQPAPMPPAASQAPLPAVAPAVGALVSLMASPQGSRAIMQAAGQLLGQMLNGSPPPGVNPNAVYATQPYTPFAPTGSPYVQPPYFPIPAPRAYAPSIASPAPDSAPPWSQGGMDILGYAPPYARPPQPGEPGFIGPVRPVGNPTGSVQPRPASDAESLRDLYARPRTYLPTPLVGLPTPQAAKPDTTSPTPTTTPRPASGGGSGSGGSTPAPGTDDLTAAGVPSTWGSWFKLAFGADIPTYYATEGGTQAALNDYKSFQSVWYSKVGRGMTPEELNRFMASFVAWAARQGRLLKIGDLLDYTQRVLYRPQPANVTAINVTEQ